MRAGAKGWIFWTILICTGIGCAPKVIPVEQTRTLNREVDAGFKSDSATLKFIEPFEKKLSAEMNEKLVKVNQVMHHEGRNSQIGHWMCDILHESGAEIFESSPDAAFYNPGGIRIAFIDTGWLTKRRVYELVPFDNYLVRLEMDSANIQTLCDHMATRGGWPTSEGFTYDIFKDKALNVRIKGEALVSGKTYSVLTNDYIANGGDQCSFLIPLERENSGWLVRELLIDYLRNKENAVDFSPKRRIELMME